MIHDLGVIYPEDECTNMVNWLVWSVTGMDKKDISFHPEQRVNENIKAELLKKFDELMDHKPIQYVTGTAYFYDLELEVNPSVLIPRPETEELVKWVAEDNKANPALSVLDIGTGSGCIILALGRLLKSPRLKAVDISNKALATARRNAEKYRIPVDFKRLDVLDANGWDDPANYDLIVSNPPYVTEAEKSRMRPNVLNFEPHQALFVKNDDPLVFYRAIAKFSKEKLSRNGKLYLEINENLGEETVLLLKNEGYSEITIKKDMRGKDRMIRCQ